MAYTQSYGIAIESPPEAIKRCVADLAKLAMHGYEQGQLAGPVEYEGGRYIFQTAMPVIGDDQVIFKGDPLHNPRGTAFYFPPPDYGSQLVTKAVAAGVQDGIYEDLDSGDWVSLSRGTVPHDIRTHLQPFDAYVVAALLLVRDHLGEFAWISSDGFGGWADVEEGRSPEDYFAAGRQLVQECCGYLPNAMGQPPTDIRVVLGQAQPADTFGF